MEIFFLTLKQMLMMFSLILVGLLLRKKSILPDDSDSAMAKLETFVFCPALAFYTQITKCTVQTFKENSALIFYGLAVILVAIALSYPLSKCFVRNHAASSELSYSRNIYKYAMTFGNYGFMGNFIILGVWGEDFFYKYSLFTFFVAIFCSSWGLYILIPKDKNASALENIKKGLLTPPMIALVLGVILGLLDVGKYMPDFFVSALNEAAKCQGPIAMLLAGFVVGGYNIKEILFNKKVYIATFLRLVVIPGVMMVALKLLGASEEIMILALITFATPLGLNTIVYPAAYGGETKTGASMALVSHTLSVITIPLMYLIFIVLL